MTVNMVFIVGSGLMGSGIAQVCAQAGIEVSIYDIDPKALDKALKGIKWSVNKFVEKGKVEEDVDTIMSRIKTVSDFSAAAEAALVIEAVFENFELKQEVFRKADEAAGSDALIASNTSAIPITELAAVTGRPDQVLGLHFSALFP